MNKIRLFISWMATKMTADNFKLYAELLISLTREQFNNFRQEDMKRLYNMSRPSHIEPHTPMTTFTGHTKSSGTSESQITLNNFQRGTKRDASAYLIFKNDLNYDTFQRSFLAIIKPQGLYDVADPDYNPSDGDQYEQELFHEKQSFVYSVLVTSLQTEKGRELVKEFEGDARSILSKLYHYHTQSNVAQHEVVTLTTYSTNLSLTDSWKGTTRQFLSHLKEKVRLLDSLVPDTDKIPETVRITFLQRAVQLNHDLRQIHVLDSVWRSKKGSTGKFTFEVYYDLLWNAAYQHDLNKATKQTQRKVFISHQNDPCDALEHDPEEEDFTIDQNQDEPSPYSVFQFSFNSSAPKKPTKLFIPYQLWGDLPEAAKQMVIEYN